MAWQWTPYTILLIVTAAISIITALHTWRRRHTSVAATGVLVLLAAAVWALGHALQLGSVDLPVKVFWSKMQFLGVVTVPTAWLTLALQYTGREKWLKPRYLGLLSVLPLITFLLVLTNEAHGLVWRRVALDTSGSFTALEQTRGVWLRIFEGYSYIVVLFSAFLFTQVLIRSRYFHRRQARALLFAGSIPLVASVIDMLGLSALHNIELVPAALTVSTIVVTLRLVRLRVGDIVSVSRGAIIESISDGVVVLDEQNRIVDLNPVAQRLSGYTLSQAFGQPVEQIWPEWPGQLELPRPGVKVSKEVVLGQGDEQGIYDMRISPLTDWLGRLISQVIVLRDITERVQAEEALRRERDLAEALEEAAAVVSSTLDPDQVLDRILEQVSRVVPNDATNIMLIDGAQVLIVRWRGYERFGGEELVSTVVLRIPEVASLQQMMDSREPMVIPDTATYPGWIHVPLTEWLRSYAAAPIIVRGEVIGFLNVDSATLGFFTHTHADALRAFADHAAAAIENARLYEETQEQVARLARKTQDLELVHQVSRAISSSLDLTCILEMTVEHMVDVFEADHSGILLFDEAHAHGHVVAEHPSTGAAAERFPVQGYLAAERIIADREPLVIEDVWSDPLMAAVREAMQRLDIRSMLIVPLVVKDEVVGSIGLDAIGQQRHFSVEEVALAQTIANQVAIAIENARLYERAQQEIVERVRAEEQIKASLQEKEVLLKEIHHRVKNNLQVISSLLYLQSKNIKDQQPLEILQDSQNRVRSMSLVHEKLYQSQDLARVDFAKYVRSLANYLFRSYGVNANVTRLRIQVEDVFLGVDTAIPCGLILNELVSNSLKHAFPHGKEGEIRIELRADEGQLTLMVSDNGIGFPEDLDFRSTGSLGLQLISTLVDQLEGTIELDRRGGTAFKIALAAPVDREKVANDQ